jgi:chromosome segregation ATPase
MNKHEQHFPGELDGLKKQLDKDRDWNNALHSKHEKRHGDLRGAIDAEGKSRGALADDCDQALKKHHGKLHGMIKDMGDSHQNRHNDLLGHINDSLDKERAARDGQLAAHGSNLDGHKASLDGRLAALEDGHSRLHDRINLHPQSLRDVEANIEKVEEALSRQLKENAVFSSKQLQEEQRAREQSDLVVEEQIVCLDEFYGSIRELVVGSVMKPMAKKNLAGRSPRAVEYGDDGLSGGRAAVEQAIISGIGQGYGGLSAPSFGKARIEG